MEPGWAVHSKLLGIKGSPFLKDATERAAIGVCGCGVMGILEGGHFQGAVLSASKGLQLPSHCFHILSCADFLLPLGVLREQIHSTKTRLASSVVCTDFHPSKHHPSLLWVGPQ